MTTNLIVIHPLVLIQVVDHYHRNTVNGRNKRVVGALLGKSNLMPGERKADGVIDVSNCYAIPFEEDPNDQNIWYLDHIYNETMYDMLRKVSAFEILRLQSMKKSWDGTLPATASSLTTFKSTRSSTSTLLSLFLS